MMSEAELAAWLEARVLSEAGFADLRKLLEAGVEGVLERPLAEVASAAVMSRSLDALLTPERLQDLARFSVRIPLASAVEELGTDPTPVGAHLSADARGRLEGLVTREGLVDEGWIDVVFSQGATEELFADTLFRALDDFSETIPQVVQSVTPAAFGKLASKLGGATGGVRGRMREELQRRLEPEIRRFVQRATRRLLDGTAGFVKARIDGEGAREARRNLLRHALERPAASYFRHLDPDARGEVEAVLVEVAQTDTARAELRARVLAVHARLLERFGDRSLRAVLAAHEVELAPDYDAWAEALWPSVQAAARSSGAREVYARWARELLEAIRAEG
jgi:hypothetical protein